MQIPGPCSRGPKASRAWESACWHTRRKFLCILKFEKQGGKQMARAGEGKIISSRQPCLGQPGLGRAWGRGGCQNPLSHRARRDPEKRGRWAPTKHGQREQEILPQLVTQAQPQMPVPGLLCAEVAVVHSHFHLLGHVVGTKTEGKAVVRACWPPALFSWRGSGSAK